MTRSVSWKLVVVLGFVGFGLSAAGFFLPWMRAPRYGEPREVIGMETSNVGIPVIGCLILFLSLHVLISKPFNIATPLLMGAGSFIVIFGTVQWLYHPIPFSYDFRAGTSETLYGAFVTLAGGIVAMGNSVLSAFNSRITASKNQK